VVNVIGAPFDLWEDGKARSLVHCETKRGTTDFSRTSGGEVKMEVTSSMGRSPRLRWSLDGIALKSFWPAAGSWQHLHSDLICINIKTDR
jgi:hypothetical protein